jgi:hypothetical protein
MSYSTYLAAEFAKERLHAAVDAAGAKAMRAMEYAWREPERKRAVARATYESQLAAVAADLNRYYQGYMNQPYPYNGCGLGAYGLSGF